LEIKQGCTAMHGQTNIKMNKCSLFSSKHNEMASIKI